MTPATAPRITGLNSIPTTGTDGTQLFAPAPPFTFPQNFPSTGGGAFAVYWGSDQNIKTPYAYTFDLSVQRDLGKGFTLDVAYVGRLAHRLLSQEDVATPEDIRDPKTGSRLFRGGNCAGESLSSGRADEFHYSCYDRSYRFLLGRHPSAAQARRRVQPFCSGGSTKSVLQAAYDLFSCDSGNETSAIQAIDQGALTDANLPGVSYYGPGRTVCVPLIAICRAVCMALDQQFRVQRIAGQLPPSHDARFAIRPQLHLFEVDGHFVRRESNRCRRWTGRTDHQRLGSQGFTRRFGFRHAASAQCKLGVGIAVRQRPMARPKRSRRLRKAWSAGGSSPGLRAGRAASQSAPATARSGPPTGSFPARSSADRSGDNGRRFEKCRWQRQYLWHCGSRGFCVQRFPDRFSRRGRLAQHFAWRRLRQSGSRDLPSDGRCRGRKGTRCNSVGKCSTRSTSRASMFRR